ncbi:class I SAM-dependent methyltransferase [Kibdelosporangium phytohabitans]|uniref:Methyltransferase n=1 Tax=Kibdelosporangium phytohabitans TaxID=860235 RepID=A0A0N9I218_9PSEU|nr:class I SAM-dependent methyltransferase [Kibdelosporangium phytohabitans]ALG12618.1 methyltransferase [Kibdelosporangium phytohabitans]MBE1464260.1 SAM-dependent methyltransferase [Kibdelosporangium phytohabitans]
MARLRDIVPVVHEHPLAYVIGLQGIALLQGFIGEHDREFIEARLAEVRELLADERLARPVDVTRVSTVDGYRTWSATYDDPANAAFAIDVPVVKRIVDELPAGTALDAACGTGRYAELLVERGHRVIGVDSSPEMLELARKRLPGSEFREGTLHHLPVDEVDLVVCGLALTHNPDLTPIFAEFARVLRPGGHLVIADIHPDGVLRGSIPTVRGPNGEPHRLVTYRHSMGDYVRAALAAGLTVRHCEEPQPEAPPPGSKATDVGPWDVWPWSLAALVPEAAHAAVEGQLVVWHFQRDSLRTM